MCLKEIFIMPDIVPSRYFAAVPMNTDHAPRWLVMLNLIGVGLGAAVLIASLLIGEIIAKEPPFDYAILMRSADIFCFDQPNFQYGISTYTDGGQQRSFYPAPFYTTFCVLHRYMPTALLIVWQFLPFLLAVWLAGRRAAVLVYPPLFILLLLGQSSGLLLPLYIVAAWTMRGYKPRWWHGLTFIAAVFKPHIAFPAVVYLLYRWRRQPAIFFTGCAALASITIPAFIIMPDWVLAWLPNGRGFEPVNLAAIARIPVRMFDIGFAPTAWAQMAVWAFCGIIAVILLMLLRWRHKNMTFYDMLLVFCFCIPLLNDYDLIIILPFIAPNRRRLLLALTAGIIAWMYAVMSGAVLGNLGYYNMSVLITLVLLVDRMLHHPNPEPAPAVPPQ